jgi:hypothetical protein
MKEGRFGRFGGERKRWACGRREKEEEMFSQLRERKDKGK